MAIAESEVETVRRLYAAFAARDLATMFRAKRRLVPAGPESDRGKHHRGWPAIRDDLIAKTGPLSGGTFRAELLDIAVGVNYVIAVQHATARHDGRSLDITGCQLIRLVEGRIVEIKGHYSDQYALDAFWQSK
jgi:ketosteroid isomerase-like protein